MSKAGSEKMRLKVTKRHTPNPKSVAFLLQVTPQIPPKSHIVG